MKKISIRAAAALLITLVCFTVSAQDKQMVIMTQNDYGTQTWFYNGAGNGLDTDKIKEKYNQDYYITSVAYTANGWFVAMTKDCGLTGQSYYYTEKWPSDWLAEKEKAGYYITSISHGNGKWMIVVSQGTGYTDQTWEWDTWSNVRTFIKAKWDNDYDITQAEFMNGKWLVVMSKNTPYTSQGYATRSSFDDATEKISSYWNEGKRIQLLEYGDGVYLIVASKLKSGKTPAQSYSTKTGDTKSYISKGWDEGKSLSYIGGGYSTQQPAQPQTIANHNHGGKTVVVDATVPFMNGTTRHIIYSDGSGYSENNFPCTSLHCYNGLCTICNGTGIAVHPFLGTTMPCTICNMGKCKYCAGKGRITSSKHWAPGEAQAYNDAVRALKNAGHNVPERNKSNSGVCPDCNGHGYRPQAYTYAAESSFAPYHNYAGNTCPICNRVTDHYHYRCTTCKRK